MNTKQNLSIPINAEDHQIIIGTILGDAYVSPSRNNRPTAAIRFGHSGDQQGDYCDHKAKLLSKFGKRDCCTRKTNFIKRRNKNYNKADYDTKYTTDFHEYRKRFYPDGVKIIPKDIDNDLTPLSLAIWYMDDGGIEVIRDKKSNGKTYVRNSIKLHTNGFEKSDVEILREAIFTKFGIKMRLKFADEKKHYVLYTKNRVQIEKFITIIRPFIIPSMVYKITTSYKNKVMKKFYTKEKLLRVGRKLNLISFGDFKKYRRGKSVYDSIRLRFGSISNYKSLISF